MSTEEAPKEVIWGSIPVPTEEEVSSSWQRIVERMVETSRQGGPEIGQAGHRQYWQQLKEASPALALFIHRMAKRVGEREHMPDAERIYLYGALDVLELMGAVAVNRQFESIIPNVSEGENNEEPEGSS